MLRTHTCGELAKKNEGETVKLTGWVHRRRDHGGVIFIDLRDRYGLTQVKFDPQQLPEADQLRSEWVIQIKGTVVARPDDMVNEKMATGEIEIEVEALNILSEAQTPPFEIDEEKGQAVNEETRMKYRYLDWRRPERMRVLEKRHEFIAFIREHLNKKGFLEVETPVLTKSTPEGARDFLVPVRQHPGQFYALPQSPQQYKQLLMLSGVDKYFQIARCFRDEDTRGDRQAEFTQLDIEMSFVERDDVLDLIEETYTRAIETVFPEKKLKWKPWPRLEYNDVMLKYGVDKPDLRFDMEIMEVSDLVKDSGFSVFRDAVKNGGVVRALCAPGAGSMPRSRIDGYTEFVKKYNAKGLAYIVVEDGNLKSPIIKFLGEETAQKIVAAVGAASGDIIFFGADKRSIVEEALGNLRQKLGHDLGLVDDNEIALAFVINFPLFEEEKVGEYYAPSHHMFTAPRPEDVALLDTDPGQVRSQQYDMVANGFEVGGGSIRIHDRDLQAKIFELIGFSDERKRQFKHFLRAFQYGVPPHGGIAPGLDRMLMLLTGTESIRDVMAFPKTGDGRDLTMEAPSEVEEGQLKELGIRVVE